MTFTELLQNIKSNPFNAYAIIPPESRMTGYEMETTYYSDFLVCLESESAIRDTYKRACLMAKGDKIYGTELALVLNWLMWAFADVNDKIARLYHELWSDLNGYILDNWKGDDLDYYVRTTD